VNDALLNVTEDSSERYVDMDLTDYSSTAQPVVPEPNSSLGQVQNKQKSADMERANVSVDKTLDTADKVDLPEGLLDICLCIKVSCLYLVNIRKFCWCY